MTRNLPKHLLFFAGLAVICWIAAGYLGSNPLGATVALVIGICYVAGGIELHRYQRATASLDAAVAALAAPPSSLDAWLEQLPAGLRHAVRLRIEGARAALPAPTLTPYLIGLLVLLGMLGTLLGMMATLRGTGLALESATDLQAIRGSLAAPVKGLGFAFGTSIAGVAASAMLGLLSALCRRERLQAVHALDAKIATTLHAYSQTHQRAEAFKLLQRQTEAMPVLVDRLQAMMETLERQHLAAGERLVADQKAFHARTEAVYTRLAASVEQSLKASVAESAGIVGTTLQPVVEATMAGIARETAALQDAVHQMAQRQVDGLSTHLRTATDDIAGQWNVALERQQQANASLLQELRATQDGFAEAFGQRSETLVEVLSSRFESAASRASEAWDGALVRQNAAHEELSERNRNALASAAAAFGQQATSLAQGLQQSHANLQAALEAREQERLSAWSGTLAAMTAELDRNWRQAGDAASERQREICDTLARTASDISAQSQAHARDTIAEISRLVQAASEAPKAAADVVAELRQKLSDSMVRDTAMLEERSRLLGTLETLLDAVNHASTEQRTAVDALVATSADLLERVGNRLAERVEAETARLDTAAAQITGSVVEVASLGEAFGAAVHAFGQSNEALMERLDRIGGALDQSLSRSDEQLAYYVAQAREVIDLSLLSQKQIIDDLQRLGGQRTLVDSEAA
ncbi:DUF802 domain-containing protein [Pseudoxanthomonas helianthi]|uniref:DUF802 domain-containing protein n=1 Tax=Pseudoxanthomonas helianthi TaxID=1453541 RepID=A0A941ASD9_9GAMM|nr:DUF802 domain-containing protein [Pseudoxanthomonas helianthi]MBP3983415.1 DUF802 domain-containing protein [Pseudoxanthomonas helianthi]